MSKHFERDDSIYACGCVKGKALDTGHYFSQISEGFKVALGFAIDCFDRRDLEDSRSRNLH